MITSNIKIKSVFAALLFSFLFGFPLFSQNLDFKIEKYSKVKIFFQSKDQIKQLAKTGLIFDHVTCEKNPAGTTPLHPDHSGFFINSVIHLC